MKKITITIAENIRVKQYEIIKPAISMEYEVPEGVDLEEFYQEKYRETKRLWNMHLYNMVYNVDVRRDAKNLHEYVDNMILGRERFPVFKLDKKEKEAL
tara:strand:- start:165 stop:461 length:297 start_codon:yes stop_codon:yes gene_type:complete